MEPIRVLIVDDHPVFLVGLKTLLGTLPEIELVGEARSGEEAVKLSLDLQPDVILMDILMEGLGGIEATRQIINAQPLTGIIMLTMFDNGDSVFAATRAGARGYMLKGADQDQIVRTIHAVANGECVFDQKIADLVIKYFAEPPKPFAPDVFPQLTPREREVLELIARGHSNTKIAEQLFLSEKTIRNNVSSIYRKLNAHDRTTVALMARGPGPFPK